MDYDKVIITPVPSFYKNKLFNEIANKQKIFVIYTGQGDDERNEDFFKGELIYDHTYLPLKKFMQIYTGIKLLRRLKYKQLIVSGWFSPISWVSVLYSKKLKNGCIVESSIYDTESKNDYTLLKRIFLKRISIVYASGLSQEKLVRKLKYQGKIVKFGGCGLLNYISQPTYQPRENVKNFLYVGRLTPVKNLRLLISAFNKLPDLQLNIIGFGSQEAELKAMAQKNIQFLGAIGNQDLNKYYQDADVFILPSYNEPWGLVVEEALNNGTPVIVSNKVGSKDDLVSNETGIVFIHNDLDSLTSAILKITNLKLYNKLRLGISKLDFLSRAKFQVAAFINN